MPLDDHSDTGHGDARDAGHGDHRDDGGATDAEHDRLPAVLEHLRGRLRADAAALVPFLDGGLGLPAIIDPETAAFLGRPRVVADLRKLATSPAWLRAAGWRSLLCRPVDGGVLLLTARRPTRFTRASLADLDAYADHLSTLSTLRRAEQRVAELITRDPLTGLGNRALLVDRLGVALHRAQRHPGLVVLVSCDVDDLRSVNDAFGRAAGDRLLIEVATRLREVVRPEDTVVRCGDDEFVVVAEQVPDEATAHQLAQRVLQTLTRPFALPGATAVYPRVSVGLATCPPAGSADELLGNAELALAAAKNAGRGRVAAYDPAVRERDRGRVRLRSDLHRALDRGQLAVHYQPIVELETRRVVGAEALVRWQHPELGTLLPAAFLPLADDDELGRLIDEHVLETACRELTELGTRHGRRLEIWVNASARTITSPGLRDAVLRVNRRFGLPPRQLTIEIPEAVLLHDLSAATAVLDDLRALGAGLAVDDFGTGHTALSYLTRLPVTAVKLDPSVVQGIDADPIAEIVVSSVTGLAQAMGLTTVAEGIEEPRQLQVITGTGCARGQGYALGRPAPITDLAPALSRPARPYAVT